MNITEKSAFLCLPCERGGHLTKLFVCSVVKNRDRYIGEQRLYFCMECGTYFHYVKNVNTANHWAIMTKWENLTTPLNADGTANDDGSDELAVGLFMENLYPGEI